MREFESNPETPKNGLTTNSHLLSKYNYASYLLKLTRMRNAGITSYGASEGDGIVNVFEISGSL